MTSKIFSLILLSVSMSAIAQIVLKIGMSTNNIQATLNLQETLYKSALTIFTNPYVIGGLAMYTCGAVLWLLVLAKLDVSMAYPYIGMGFIITMLLGWMILGETLSVSRIIGTLLVVAGVTLISVQPLSNQ